MILHDTRESTTRRLATRAGELRSAAESLIARGFRVCRLKPGEKNPSYTGWPLSDFPLDEFRDGDGLGLVGGKQLPDGTFVVGLDIDSPVAIERADEFLPPTRMIDGRPGKRRSHRIYALTDIPEHLLSTCPSAIDGGMGGPMIRSFSHEETGKEIIKICGTGAQVAIPPTIWESKDGHQEQRFWEDCYEPAIVDTAELYASVEALAEDCGWVRPKPVEDVPIPEVDRDGDRDHLVSQAERYVSKIEGAISGQHGHDKTYRVARILAGDFQLTWEEAWPLLVEYNRRCEPVWNEEDLNRKLQEAFKKPPDPARQKGVTRGPRIKSRKRKSPSPDVKESAKDETPTLFNFRIEKRKDEGGKTIDVIISKTAQTIHSEIINLTDGWPKRVGARLFVEGDGHKPNLFEKTTDLFGWLHSQLPADGPCRLKWTESQGFVTKAEMKAFLEQQAESYEHLETSPHWPPLPDFYYMHPSLEGGDGSHLGELLNRFAPATEIDRQLIKALFLSLVWGGQPGQRPAWLITAEDNDPNGGRGVGKSKLALLAPRLVGGSVEVKPNQKYDDVVTRLLSPEGMTKRVMVLDNLKTHRFSWDELEGLITTDMISGRLLYVGEGRRPNTLTTIITLNGVSLSRDLAQRCVIVKLKRPEFQGNWESGTAQMIREHRWAILGDIVAELRRDTNLLPHHSRWGSWEDGVLSRVDDPKKCQDEIKARQESVDEDAEESGIVRDAFAEALKDRGFHPTDRYAVRFSCRDITTILREKLDEKKSINKVTGYLKSLSIPELRHSILHGKGCWTWEGKDWTGEGVANFDEPIPG